MKKKESKGGKLKAKPSFFSRETRVWEEGLRWRNALSIIAPTSKEYFVWISCLPPCLPASAGSQGLFLPLPPLSCNVNPFLYSFRLSLFHPSSSFFSSFRWLPKLRFNVLFFCLKIVYMEFFGMVLPQLLSYEAFFSLNFGGVFFFHFVLFIGSFYFKISFFISWREMEQP